MTPDDILAWWAVQPKRPTRVEMAARYRDVLLTYWNRFGEMPNVAGLNQAILERWSLAGLTWIKREAWKAAEQTVRVNCGL